MINSVSDFKLAESVLKMLCYDKGITFADVPVSFEPGDVFDGESLPIGATINIAQTIYKIVDSYINYSPKIVGKLLFDSPEEKKNFLINFTNILRSILYVENTFSDEVDELILQHLYQYNLVWLLMKDIICPTSHVVLDNIKIVAGSSPYIDIAQYYKEGDIEKEGNVNYPFVFVNVIDNKVVQHAFLFIEILKAHDLNPYEVVQNIFESDLYEKFIGLLKLAFTDSAKIEEFVSALVTISSIDWNQFVPSKNASLRPMMQKVAQFMTDSDRFSQWWNLGILERMLAPVRGADWSIYKELGPLSRIFWDQVEELKRKKKAETGEVGIPFDTLLRLKVKDELSGTVDPTRTIQDLLSSNRVW